MRNKRTVIERERILDIFRLRSIFFFGMVVLAISGCASTYKASEEQERGTGYSEKRSSEGVYFLRFNGLGNEEVEKILVLWHRRAAELCGENNYSGTPRKKKVEGVYTAFSNGVMYPESVTTPYVEGKVECKDKQLARRAGPSIYNPSDDIHKLKLAAVTAPGVESGDKLAQNLTGYVNSQLKRYGSDPALPGKFDMNIVITRFVADGWHSNLLFGGVSGGTYEYVSVVTILDAESGQGIGEQEISTEVSAGGESEYRLKNEHAREIVEYAVSVFQRAVRQEGNL